MGKYICDSFYKIPYPEEHSFIHRIMEVCTRENIDVILPQVTRELPILSTNIELLHRYGIQCYIKL